MDIVEAARQGLRQLNAVLRSEGGDARARFKQPETADLTGTGTVR